METGTQSVDVGLASLLTQVDSDLGPLEIVCRERNEYDSRSNTEILTCRRLDGTQRDFLLKACELQKGLANGLLYEAEVYRRVVQPSGMSAPAFHGLFVDEETGSGCMLLEYVTDGVLLSERLDSEVMCQAARWLGQFQAIQEARESKGECEFLKVYDAQYYIELAQRAHKVAVASQLDFRWLEKLLESFEEFITPVLNTRSTIAHGDYHPHNILWRNGKIYPIDWECAGIDLGEMDLVCLTDGWDQHTTKQCEVEYKTARWPSGPPADFNEILSAARLCLYFHNLGSRANWTADPHRLWCSEQLRAVAEGIGLI